MADGHPVYAAIYAAALSGDADTVGAIACAIAGTWQGVEVIPADHLETIRQANPQYNFEQTADGLYEIALRNYQARPSDEDNRLGDLFTLED
jgi:ADP-ribosylglycohydrolase